MRCGWPGPVHSVEDVAVFAFYIVIAAIDVAFAISMTPSRFRMPAALATAAAAFGALCAHLPVVPWLPYVVAATYLGAVLNRQVEATETQVVTRRRVPRL